MKDFYPYLLEHKERVKKTIYSEEVRFLKTLASGEQLLRKMMEDTSTLTGEEAFKLYDTYGFPIELTVEIASENGVKVDMDGFHDEMKKQKERARAARGDLQSMNRQSADLMSFTLPSEFDYESTNMEARIIGLFKDGKRVDVIEEEGDVIFDHTCFYSESGGQAPDKGTIMNGETEAEVLDVQKAPNHQFLHHVHLLYGTLHEGDILSLAIDTKKRYLTRKNHSSAHLLQSALRKVLGDHVHQEGSYVDDEIMRFDFSHSSKITDTELKEIEALVNGWINDAIEQKTLLLPIEEAKKTGATALFDEKYGDVVRVVTFGDVSKEFCGGTHVHNTAEIGCFAIEFEESIASGVRRIQARTGLKAYELLKKREALLADIQAMMKAGSYLEIQDRLKTLLHEKEVLALENHRLKEKEASFEAKQLENRFVMYNGVHLLAAYLNDTDRDGLMKRMDQLKTVYDDDVIVLIGGKDGNLPIVSHVSALAQKEGIRAGDLVKAVSGILGGSGGGRPEMASGGGKDASKIDEALAKVKELIA